MNLLIFYDGQRIQWKDMKTERCLFRLQTPAAQKSQTTTLFEFVSTPDSFMRNRTTRHKLCSISVTLSGVNKGGVVVPSLNSEAVTNIKVFPLIRSRALLFVFCWTSTEPSTKQQRVTRLEEALRGCGCFQLVLNSCGGVRAKNRYKPPYPAEI